MVRRLMWSFPGNWNPGNSGASGIRTLSSWDRTEPQEHLTSNTSATGGERGTLGELARLLLVQLRARSLDRDEMLEVGQSRKASQEC